MSGKSFPQKEKKLGSNTGVGRVVTQRHFNSSESTEPAQELSLSEDEYLFLEWQHARKSGTTYSKLFELKSAAGLNPIQHHLDDIASQQGRSLPGTSHKSLALSYLEWSAWFLPVFKFPQRFLPDIPLLTGVGAADVPAAATRADTQVTDFASEGMLSGMRQQDPPTRTPDFRPLTSESYFGETPLEKKFLQAIEKQNLQAVKDYLENPKIRERLNLPDSDGNFPIIHAARSGHSDITSEIFLAGADLNAQTKTGQTAVMIAASQPNPSLLIRLVHHGADINHRDHSGRDAEKIAEGTKSKEMLLFVQLYKRYVTYEVHLHNHNNEAVLQDIAYFQNLSKKTNHDWINSLFGKSNTLIGSAAANGNLPAVKRLLGIGAQVDFAEFNNLTALQLACFYGHLEVVEELLAHGANPNLARLSEYHPIVLAAKTGHTAIVKTLHNRGVSLDIVDFHGLSLLTLATYGNHLELLETLVSSGLKDNHDQALVTALNNRNEQAVGILLGAKKHMGQTAIMRAAERGDRYSFGVLFMAGTDLTAVDNKGNDLRYYAEKGGIEDLYDQLTEKPDDHSHLLQPVGTIFTFIIGVLSCCFLAGRKIEKHSNTAPIENEQKQSPTIQKTKQSARSPGNKQQGLKNEVDDYIDLFFGSGDMDDSFEPEDEKESNEDSEKTSEIPEEKVLEKLPRPDTAIDTLNKIDQDMHAKITALGLEQRQMTQTLIHKFDQSEANSTMLTQVKHWGEAIVTSKRECEEIKALVSRLKSAIDLQQPEITPQQSAEMDKLVKAVAESKKLISQIPEIPAITKSENKSKSAKYKSSNPGKNSQGHFHPKPSSRAKPRSEEIQNKSPGKSLSFRTHSD